MGRRRRHDRLPRRDVAAAGRVRAGRRGLRPGGPSRDAVRGPALRAGAGRCGRPDPAPPPPCPLRRLLGARRPHHGGDGLRRAARGRRARVGPRRRPAHRRPAGAAAHRRLGRPARDRRGDVAVLPGQRRPGRSGPRSARRPPRPSSLAPRPPPPRLPGLPPRRVNPATSYGLSRLRLPPYDVPRRGDERPSREACTGDAPVAVVHRYDAERGARAGGRVRFVAMPRLVLRPDDPRLAGLLATAGDQGDVVSRRQVYACGLTRWHVRGQVRARRWATIGDQSVCLHRAEPSVVGLRWAAVFQGDPRAHLDGATALLASGLERYSDERIRVSVPRGARIRRTPQFDIRQTRRWTAGDMVTTGIPRARPAVAAVRGALWAVSDRQAALLLTMTTQQ